MPQERRVEFFYENSSGGISDEHSLLAKCLLGRFTRIDTSVELILVDWVKWDMNG
jgi:hypothetical protein